MIEEYAVVTGRNGALASLALERRTACGICGQKRGCGNAAWSQLSGRKTQAFNAENRINANVGDSVIVGIDEQLVLKSVFYLYIVPLMGLIVGTVLTELYFHDQLYVIFGAFTGLALGFLGVKTYLLGPYSANGVAENHAANTRYQAVILRYADNEPIVVNGSNDN